MYAMEHDPITGAECYRHIKTGEISSDKPLSLGSERWDQDDMMLWTVEEVSGRAFCAFSVIVSGYACARGRRWLRV